MHDAEAFVFARHLTVTEEVEELKVEESREEEKREERRKRKDNAEAQSCQRGSEAEVREKPALLPAKVAGTQKPPEEGGYNRRGRMVVARTRLLDAR